MNYNFLHEVSKMAENENPIITSRAASAIFLSLAAFGKKGKILLPSTICLSPIMAAKAAGFEVVFVGVEHFQMDLKTASNLIASDPSITAILIPELYGYPVPDMEIFWKTVEHREILIIEDLAQTSGKSRLSKYRGMPTIATVYSFGETKYFSEIRCGALTTPDSNFTKEISDLNARMEPDSPSKFLLAQQKYSSTYQNFLRTSPTLRSWKTFFDEAMKIDRVLYTPKLDLPEFKTSKALVSRARIQERNNKHVDILRGLNSVPNIVVPEMTFMDFPIWRTTVRVNPEFRNDIVAKLRAINLPVSTWYLAMHKYVPSSMPTPGLADLYSAEAFEDEVINFFIEDLTSLSYANAVREIILEVMN